MAHDDDDDGSERPDVRDAPAREAAVPGLRRREGWPGQIAGEGPRRAPQRQAGRSAADARCSVVMSDDFRILEANYEARVGWALPIRRAIQANPVLAARDRFRVIGKHEKAIEA